MCCAFECQEVDILCMVFLHGQGAVAIGQEKATKNVLRLIDLSLSLSQLTLNQSSDRKDRSLFCTSLAGSVQSSARRAHLSLVNHQSVQVVRPLNWTTGWSPSGCLFGAGCQQHIWVALTKSIERAK